MTPKNKQIAIVGGAAAAGTLLGVLIGRATKKDASTTVNVTTPGSGGGGGTAPPAPTGADYNAQNAISTVAYDASAAASITVAKGSSVAVSNAAGADLFVSPGVISSDNTVMAPSMPATTDGFVAVKAGTSILSGAYLDASGQPVTVQVVVTVTDS